MGVWGNPEPRISFRLKEKRRWSMRLVVLFSDRLDVVSSLELLAKSVGGSFLDRVRRREALLL